MNLQQLQNVLAMRLQSYFTAIVVNMKRKTYDFSVPLDTAKQKQDNINKCLLCNRRNFKMKAIKKIIPVL